MNEDEIREALKKIRVEDVLLQTAATLIDLAARRMGLTEEDGPKQLDQAKLAIDAIRALAAADDRGAAGRDPGAAVAAPDGVRARGAERPPSGPETAAEPAPEAGSEPDDDAERAKARAKIWTPPGA